jgi:methyl-accepting chemotaxis protein
MSESKKTKFAMRLKLGTKINMIVLGIVLFLSVTVGIVVVERVTAGIKEFAVEKAKGDLEVAYRYIDKEFEGKWHINGGKLFKGTTSFNMNYSIVDLIAKDTGDTVTFFQGDTRIATNVMVDGKRAIGTQVSPEVAEQVLKNGRKYYGEAEVAGNGYQTAYMPLKDENNQVIGIFYVGASQKIIDTTIASFLKIFLFVLAIVIIISVIFVYWFTRRLKKRLSVISNALNHAGSGNFTNEIKDDAGDELSELSQSYNEMRLNLKHMIQEVLQTTEQVAASAEQLNAGAEQTSKATEQITNAIQHIANGAENQTSNVEESAKSLEEVSKGIQNMAENSAVISEAGLKTSEQARTGEHFVAKTVDQIHAIDKAVNISSEVILLLDKRSQEIGDITKVITDIANQINLLALNAAIEAARAGEHGKGFAVVADEVRKLAELSQQSSTQISGLIKEIQIDMEKSNSSIGKVKAEVKGGLELVDETQKSFKDILQSTEGMGMQIDDMAATSQQISASAQEVAATVAGISEIARDTSIHSQSVAASTEEQLASMEEIAASANDLSERAMHLQDMMTKFTV